jgi:hypothetical protein
MIAQIKSGTMSKTTAMIFLMTTGGAARIRATSGPTQAIPGGGGLPLPQGL